MWLRRLFFYIPLSLIIPLSLLGQRTLTATRFPEPPLPDGIISRGEWPMVDSATGFIQMEPQKGKAATETTVAYLGYDNKNIYVAIISYYDNPEKIVARLQTRDELTKNDDLVAVVLDTYNDRRTAYVFFVNALNTQIDMRVSDDGRNLDLNWDTEWQSATAKFSHGWVAEFVVPFRSIKYKSGQTIWGINFGRIIRSNAETAYWSGALNDDFRISQGGILEGIEPSQPGARVKLFPYGTLRYEDSDLTGNYNKWIPDAGLDAEVGITSQLTSNLTFNPDFATVEGDQEQINLTRWELSFPEKRHFFLEGNDMFGTRIQTFYSRRIGDIDYGGKITGKIGGLSMNLLTAHSVDEPDTSVSSALYSAIRLKQDILKSSFVGVTFVDKSWENGFTRSISTDYLLNLGKTWKLTGQYVASSPGDLLTHSAWFTRFATENNIYHFHVRYSNTGKHFRDNADKTGFIRDDDMRELDSDARYRWWFQESPIKYVSLSTRNNIFWNHDAILRSWFVTESFRIYLQKRFSLDLSYNNEFKLYEKKYYNHRWGAELGYNTDEWASASLSQYWGQNYDRDFYLTTVKARVKPLEKLALEYSLNVLNYTPDTTYSSTVINVLSATYHFTNDLWIRIFTQNNTSDERIYLYSMAGWRFKPPFGALYLIYTSDDMIQMPTEEKMNSKIFFIKFTYPILIGKN